MIRSARDAILSELVKSYRRVPDFQRTYVWTVEQWIDLWNDILSAKKDEPHMIGAMVFCKDEFYERTKLIVDGQQRLATLVCLLIALRDILKVIEKKLNKNVTDEITESINNMLGDIEEHIKGSRGCYLILSSVDRDIFNNYIYEKEVDEVSSLQEKINSMREYTMKKFILSQLKLLACYCYYIIAFLHILFKQFRGIEEILISFEEEGKIYSLSINLAQCVMKHGEFREIAKELRETYAEVAIIRICHDIIENFEDKLLIETKEDDFIKALREFKRILNNVLGLRVIEIETEDLSAAFKAFRILDMRGLRLTQADLVKCFLFSVVNKDLIKKVKQEWENLSRIVYIYKELNKKARKKARDILRDTCSKILGISPSEIESWSLDYMLLNLALHYALRLYYIQDSNIRYNDLYNIVKEVISKNSRERSSLIIDFLMKLKSVTRSLSLVFFPEMFYPKILKDIEKNLPSDLIAYINKLKFIYKYLFDLKFLEAKKGPLTLLIVALSEFDINNKKQVQEMIKWVKFSSSAFVRGVYFPSFRKNQKFPDYVDSIAKMLLDALQNKKYLGYESFISDLKKPIGKRKKTSILDKVVWPKEKLKEVLIERDWKKITIREKYVLLRLSEELVRNDDERRIIAEYFERVIERYEIMLEKDHILPESGYEEHAYKFYNLALLEESLNRDAQHLPPEKKINEYYKKSAISMAKRLYEALVGKKLNDIIKFITKSRVDELAELICRVWSI